MKEFFKSKTFYVVAAVVLLLGVVLCGVYQCTTDVSSKDEAAVVDTTNVVFQFQDETLAKDFTVDITKISNMDRQQMYQVSEDYKWFETNVKLAGFLDTLTTPEVIFVANVFQTANPDNGGGYKTSVICFRHTVEGNEVEIKRDAFWLEDRDLNEADGTYLDFSEVFQKVLEANCPKPHTQYATLRRQVGPKPANPQWIFGNDSRGMIYVDAFTGDVRTENPVFE